MKNIYFLLAMNCSIGFSQSADSLVVRTREDFIQYINDDRAIAPLLAVIRTVNQNDTSFGFLSGVNIQLLLSESSDSTTFDSIVNRTMMLEDCIVLDDVMKKRYDIVEYPVSLSLLDELEDLTSQQLLDSYFNSDYFYTQESEELGYALVVTFYKRNIPMLFDDYSGYLRIDRKKQQQVGKAESSTKNKVFKKI